MARLLASAVLLAVLLGASIGAVAEDAAGLFGQKCASCHGDDGRAKTPTGRHIGAADLTSQHVQGQSDVSLYDGIAYGVGHKKYPHAFLQHGLSDFEVSQLVKYLRTFRIPKTSDYLEADHRGAGNSFGEPSTRLPQQ